MNTYISGTIYAIFPILLYLLYTMFKDNMTIKEKNILLDLSLLSSGYLVIKYSDIYILISIMLLMIYHKRYISLLILELFFMRSNMLNIMFIILNISLFIPVMPYMILSFIGIYLFNIKIWIYIIFVIGLKLFKDSKRIEEYHKSYQELKVANTIQSSLFQITHEIKNPIAVIKAYLDMFDINNIEHSKKYIPIIKSEINRLLLLLEDFSMLNKLKINKEEMDVNLLIEEVRDNMKWLLDEHDVSFEVELEDQDIYISGDYNRLSQVLLNVLKNSVEADAHNIKLKTNKDDERLILSIEDDGSGIPNSIIDKIYEPFYTTKIKGNGLGVALSNGIVEAHNGTLEYISSEGVGTTVKIVLPLSNIG